MNLAQLEDLGLTHNEAKTYTALLELGETKTGPIVKKTSMHRVLIYDALAALIKKGLASHVVKENIKYFRATQPKQLLDFLEEKRKLAEEIIPQLNTLQQATQHKQTVTVYEGLKGLKAALNNMVDELSPHGTHYVLASGDMSEAVGPYYDQYQKRKKKNKIKTYGILDVAFKKRKDLLKRTSATIRFTPLPYFPTDIWIYNDKVLIVTYKATPSIAILIQSAETAKSYKVFFDTFWKQAKP